MDALLPSLLLWLQIFHHVVTIASYSIVCLTRSVRPSVHPSGSLCLKFAPAYQLSLDLTWALRCAALLSHGGVDAAGAVGGHAAVWHMQAAVMVCLRADHAGVDDAVW